MVGGCSGLARIDDPEMVIFSLPAIATVVLIVPGCYQLMTRQRAEQFRRNQQRTANFQMAYNQHQVAPQPDVMYGGPQPPPGGYAMHTTVPPPSCPPPQAWAYAPPSAGPGMYAPPGRAMYAPSGPGVYASPAGAVAPTTSSHYNVQQPLSQTQYWNPAFENTQTMTK